MAPYTSMHAARYVNGVLSQINPSPQAAQVFGGVLGATLAILLVPDHLQRSFAGFGLGVRPGVLLWQGVACELALALILNVIVLWSLNANPYLAYWTLMGTTLVLVVVGAEFSGPSLNPAIVRCCALLIHDDTVHRALAGLSTFRGTHCWSMCLCFGWLRWRGGCSPGWSGAPNSQRFQSAAKRLENDINVTHHTSTIIEAVYAASI